MAFLRIEQKNPASICALCKVSNKTVMVCTMLNHIRLLTGLQNKTIVRALDSMQLSEIAEGKEKEHFYLRSAINAEQEKIINALKLEVPNDCTPQRLINQYFT